MNTDFVGQTIIEKVDDGIKYFSNPVQTNDYKAVFEYHQMNEELQKMIDLNRKLNHVQSNLLYSNRQKLRKIEELSEQLNEYRKTPFF